jgi:hypothetical protein
MPTSNANFECRLVPLRRVSDDCLCELAVCIYKARRLPLAVLRRTVRAVFVANEYPGTMVGLSKS